MWARDLPSVNAVNYDYLQFYVSVKSDPFTRLTFVPQPYAPSPLATRIYENAFLMRTEKPIHKKHYTKSLAISLSHDVDSRCPGEIIFQHRNRFDFQCLFSPLAEPKKKADDKTLCCFLPRRETIAKANIFRQKERKRRNRCGRVMEWKLSVQKFTARRNLFKTFFLCNDSGMSWGRRAVKRRLIKIFK